MAGETKADKTKVSIYISMKYNTHTCLTALCPGLPRWAGTRKIKPIWILLKQETVSGSGISWAICKSAPRSRQITMPAPHHSVFTGWMLFLPPNQQRQSIEGKVYLKLNSWFHGHDILLKNGRLPWKYTHSHLTAFCPELPGWACTRKLKPIRILLKQETVSGSGIGWTICKSAPHSMKIHTYVVFCYIFSYNFNALIIICKGFKIFIHTFLFRLSFAACLTSTTTTI